VRGVAILSKKAGLGYCGLWAVKAFSSQGDKKPDFNLVHLAEVKEGKGRA